MTRQLGRALLEKVGTDGHKIIEFVGKFDRNNNGVTDKMEFRLLVRNGLHMKLDNHVLDTEFDRLDKKFGHGEGHLDNKAIGQALRAFRDDGLAAEKEGMS